MSSKTIATVVALGVLGIGAALGIGLAANAISGDSIGLSAEPLRAGETLAPPQAATDDDARPTRTAPRTTTTGTTPTATTTPGDDNSGSGSGDSGRGRGRGRGRGGGDD